MKRITLSFLCILSLNLVTDSYAIDLFRPTGARSYSMGNIHSVLPGFVNPASFGFTSSSRMLSLQYQNRYGMKELSTWTAGVNYPNKFLNAGLFLSRYGMKSFHETLAGLNIYRKLSKYISLGIRLDYLNLHYSDNERNKSLITADIGMFLHMTENLNVSVLALNPFCIGMKKGETNEKLPTVLYAGISYQLVKSFILVGEIEKEIVLPVSCKLGFEYNPIKELSLRAGMFTSPVTPSFGIGLHLLPFTIDLAFSKYAQLGIQSCCTLAFNF